MAASSGSFVLASSAFFAAISACSLVASSAVDELDDVDVVDDVPNKDEAVEEDIAVTILMLPIAVSCGCTIVAAAGLSGRKWPFAYNPVPMVE